MDSLKKFALENAQWVGLIALALTIVAELMADSDDGVDRPASFVERERVRRAKDNLDWLTR